MGHPGHRRQANGGHDPGWTGEVRGWRALRSGNLPTTPRGRCEDQGSGAPFAAMNTTLDAQVEALLNCVVALAAAIPAGSAPLVHHLLAARVADKGDQRVEPDADAAFAAVYAAVLRALPASS